MDEILTKQCNSCPFEGPLSEFPKTNKTKSGYTGHCFACDRKRKTESRLKIQAENPELWKQRQASYKRTYRSKDREHLAKIEFKHRLQSKFNMTVEEYDAKLLSQKGCCHICGGKPSIRLAIDHDRKCCNKLGSCGKCVRGLLCIKCNTALGLVNDDPNILYAMIEYLGVKW